MRKAILITLILLITTLLYLSAHPLYHIKGPQPLRAPCAPPIEKSTPILLVNVPVIEGGIHSLEHLKSLVQTKMYEGVDLDSLHEVVAQRDYWAFVQYKRGGRIFWTHRLILIKRGETLYVDRNGRTIRALCGNEISATPQQPTLEVEPIDTEIPEDTAESFPIEVPPITSIIVPPLISDVSNLLQPVGIATPITPFIPIFCCGGGVVQPMPAQQVSEPNSYVFLLVLIVAAIILFSRKKGVDKKK